MTLLYLWIKEQNAHRYYYVMDRTRNQDGKLVNKVVETLGREDRLRKEHEDPEAWARAYVEELNAESTQKLLSLTFDPAKEITAGSNRLYNGGYLFLQRVYHELRLHEICAAISRESRCEFKLNNILSRLVYCRLLAPSSKRATTDFADRLLQGKDFELHQVYRALSLLSNHMDWIQARLYRNSKKIALRNDRVLYYDCSNFYWEVEGEDDFRKYGCSKEHRPNPIVQMGLFLDGSGMPLAFSTWPGNTNEQVTLKPLEEKILAEYGVEKFVVCTDAGLSSLPNRKFNTLGERAFITTQSLKKMKDYLREWALDPTGWQLVGDEESDKRWTLDEAMLFGSSRTFFKERWFKDKGLEQRLIVTFSKKYLFYQRGIREGHIERASRAIESNPSRLKTKGVNDYRRLIQKVAITNEGEVAEGRIYALDEDRIREEEMYDGFYAVCTNLEDDITDIVRISHGRWEIEEAFRILKSELAARPVYLSREDRINAHFLVCFITLLIMRIIEQRMAASGFSRFTIPELVLALQEINYLKTKGIYLPAFPSSPITHALSNTFELPIHQEAYDAKMMRDLIASTR